MNLSRQGHKTKSRHTRRVLLERAFIERAEVAKARHSILEAANGVRDARLKKLSTRHLQEAVCIVRRRRLVKPDTLRLAGFRPSGR